MTPLTIFFDPRCPWAWRTSRWVREVERQGLITVSWKLFSLGEINRDPEKQPDPGPMDSALRVLLVARRAGGQEAIDRLYLALGRAHFERKADLRDSNVIEAALTEAGLERALLRRALDDPSTHDAVLEEHHEAVTRFGAFGVPWLVVGDSEFGFYGPIISTPPTGEQARELWEHASWMLTQQHFYEIKRSR
jgi:predicted DsbA family dithiol-disulfide isomerase